MGYNDIIMTDFTKISEGQRRKILLWRNNDNIRKWMYTSNVITYDEHIKFIDNLRVNKDKIYFLITKGSEDIGVINFAKKDGEALYFGLYANPDINMQGVGGILMSVAIEYAFNEEKYKKIQLEVYRDNERAINLYKNYGFNITKEKIVNNKTVICMELVNENPKL